MISQLRFLLIILGFFILSADIIGQNQSDINQMQNMSAAQLSTININDLSDAQIKKYMEQAAQSGYSQAEIELALKSRGMPQQQIDQLKTRMAKLQSGAVKTGSGFDRARTRETPQLKTDDLVNMLTDD